LGDAAWGDFDVDGDLDLLLTGFNFSGRIAKIYVNEGNDIFTELAGTPFPGLSHSSAEWGDYDNDGDLDILFCGVDEQGGWIYYTMIYTNNGDNSFTDSNISLGTVFWGESLWGDYDADGDLDIVLTGYTPGGQVFSAIYRNDISTPNTLPQPPDSLSALVNMDEVTLSWSMAEDNETPSEGITYNIYMYKLDADTVWGSMSMITTGKRLLPDLGNANQNTTWIIKDLPDGQYFWSVQALDNNFEGSVFAEEVSFIIGTVGMDELQSSDFSITPNPSSGIVTLDFVDSYFINDIDIIDLYGNTLRSIQNLHTGMLLDLTDLSAGLYFFRFKIEDTQVTKKVIIR
jgi:hypothetical protein